jgi:glucose-1-phosphate cytidylyltransferase
MKVLILAGGLGTRISEETANKPKPMVSINGNPILWHLMNIYATQGFNEFVVATGYKGEVIEEWVKTIEENWSVMTLPTGLETQTGGRIAECMAHLSGERVFATYGDGLANVNLTALVDFHLHHGKLATVTAVRPPARFGVLESSNGLVTHFAEKNQTDSGWINGGFFVLEPEVKNFIDNPNEPFESGALSRLVKEQELMAYHHEGFWQPMDTLREKQELEKFARKSPPPWLDFGIKP